MRSHFTWAFALCVACGTPAGGPDAGSDAGRDAGVDAGTDAGVDAGPVVTVVDGGSASYDLMGGNTQMGHIVADQSAPSEHLNGTLRLEFEDVAGSTADVMQSRAVLIQFPAATGTYHCDGGMTPYFTFADTYAADGGSVLGQWNSIRAKSSCTITVTTLTAVDGGAVRGTFSGTLGVDTGIPVPDASVVISNGMFDVQY
jgi:hypothetical protein